MLGLFMLAVEADGGAGDEQAEVSPEDASWWCSRMLFCWNNRLMLKGAPLHVCFLPTELASAPPPTAPVADVPAPFSLSVALAGYRQKGLTHVDLPPAAVADDPRALHARFRRLWTQTGPPHKRRLMPVLHR